MILFDVHNGKIVRETGELPTGTRRVWLQWWKEGNWHRTGAKVAWSVSEARRHLEGPLKHPRYRIVAVPPKGDGKGTDIHASHDMGKGENIARRNG